MAKKHNKKIFIVVPAYNEANAIGEVIDSIRKEGFNNIIVVDDGSQDSTAKIARSKNAYVVKHLINRGKGAATQTGMDAAKLLDADIVVTIDADGQHYANDIKKIVKPLLYDDYDVALGSRFLRKNSIPFGKRIVNYLANLITFVFYGIYVTDSQSGFRAYNKESNARINTTMDRYEFESEILHQMKNLHLTYKEVPIKVRYTNYSKTRYNHIPDFQPQGLVNGIKMFLKMVVRSILS